MRVTMIRNSTTYEFVLEEPHGPKDARMKFEGPEALAAFLHPMIADPVNGLGYASLRRALYSGSAADALRHLKSEAEISRRMADVFIRAGGYVRQAKAKVAVAAAEQPKPPPAPVRSKSSSAPEEIPLSELKILEITFLSDHKKLKKYTKDWMNLGAVFPKPEWRPGVSSPISHSIDQKVSLKIKFLAGPPEGRTQYGTLYGKGPGHLTCDSKRRLIRAGENVFSLECVTEVPREILKREEQIAWRLELEQDGTLQGGTTGPHVIYCTYGDPKDDRSDREQEDGVTVKRMAQAVDWGGEVYTMDPHKLVDLLTGTFGSYTLEASKSVPPQYKHPHYRNLEGGAWPLAEYRKPAECQAIVRLVMGVIRQLGLPGVATAVVVFTDPDAPEQPKIELLAKGAGLRKFHKKEVDGTTWFAALTDKTVKEGEVYPSPDSADRKGKPLVGFNTYEACVKFTDEGLTRFYAGGAGIKKDADVVLKECFFDLVWYRRVMDPVFGPAYRVEKVVASYPKP